MTGTGPPPNAPGPAVPPAVRPRREAGGRPLSAYLAEVVGSAWLVLVALTAIAFTMRDGSALSSWPLTARLAVIGTAVGGSVAVFAVTPAGKESGGHLNPAVSLFMTVRGALPVRAFVTYTVGQLCGSLLGVAAARALWGGRVTAVHQGLIQPGPGWGTAEVFAGEALSTAVLLWVLAGMTARPRPRATPWVIGAVIAALIVTTGARTGASFNPARNFGPHVAAGDYHLFWTYMLAPMAGALLAAAVLAPFEAARRPWTAKVCCARDVHRYQPSR
ncbi:Glycerol uptake facilitator protein [Streptomyces sp. RB5]|uniref:Glycerol uptake facilitator protein n=1 Tax=Streptomyces smaragdinus TaxID=2585196 RepID=A0A7K0CL69_9ACTN|nr:aquaporin [Streptomyces smaragdinus]MQY13504.1 Glycerol uptake facilitator protein [Streptomyces smaragdinus]